MSRSQPHGTNASLEPRGHIRVILALFLCVTLVAKAPHAGAQEMQFTQGELIRSLLPSVVNVTVRKEVTGREPSANASAAGPSATKKEYGSGFVIDPSGVIVTNSSRRGRRVRHHCRLLGRHPARRPASSMRPG